MIGAVIENLSNRKLSVILATLLAIQIVFFLIGAWYAPEPTSYMEFELIKCNDKSKGRTDKWFYMKV